MKKFLKWAGIALGALIVIGLIIPGGDDSEETAETEEETARDRLAEQEAEETEDEAAPAEAEEEPEEAEVSTEEEVIAAGEEAANEHLRATDELDEVGYVEDGEQLLIRIATESGFSDESTRNSMYVLTHDILESLEGTEDVDAVNIGFKLPLVDTAGNESIEEVMYLIFNEDTRSNMNFGNILHENIPELADDYWHHNALE